MSLAELQCRRISLSKCKRDVNTGMCLTTKVNFHVLRGINILQMNCPKAPSPSNIITGKLSKLQSLFFLTSY